MIIISLHKRFCKCVWRVTIQVKRFNSVKCYHSGYWCKS